MWKLLLLLLPAPSLTALCDPLPGLNCWGSDLTSVGPLASASACCAACASYAGCAAWTWDEREGTPAGGCWLKSSCAGARADGNAVSGSAAPPPNGSQPYLCLPVAGVNCEHSDIADGGVVGSVGEACAACRSTRGCAAWTWNAGGDQHVWLKADCAGGVPDATAVSGAAAFPPPAPSPPPPGPPPPTYHNGVSMGGWLLTEPSWMFDAPLTAPAEADLVAALRAQGGDAFAVRTMRNHWAGYIPDAALDALAALGVNHARIPVGYWIVEAPAVAVPQPDDPPGPPTLRTFGFNHEGFATGGITYLEATLARLKARGIKALVDVHALPGGGSACQSYAGWSVPHPDFWAGAPPAGNGTRVDGCNGGGPYFSTRGASRSWRQVGEEAILALGRWVVGLEANASLAGTVVGLQVANEPGLQTGGLQPAIEALLLATVPPLQAMFKAGGVVTNVTVNFIGPNDVAAGAWLAAQVRAGIFDGARLVVDFHNYLNWDGDKTWPQLAAEVCGTTFASANWAQYTEAGLFTVIGEWSCSTNLGAKAFTDLSNPDVVAHLKTLYANQLSLYSAPAAGASGQHHWALRMGSGWDPRPTEAAPSGAQAAGTRWDQSAPGFWPAVWSLGDLIRVGVARPLAELGVQGVCKCNGCSAGG